MLALYARDGWSREPPANLEAAALPPDIVWIDLFKPEPREIAFVEEAIGLTLPSHAELSEIESSSRLRAEDGTLYLSVPVVHRADTNDPGTTPLGFVLSAERLVTIRFEPLTAFEIFTGHGDGQAAAHVGAGHPSGADVFAGLAEAIVDRLADILEHIATELDILSHRLFRTAPAKTELTRRPARQTADLRVILRRVGHGGDLSSKIRDSLLAFARIVPYAAAAGTAWISPEVKTRLETLRLDVMSLSDYDAHLLNKVQLLLDATLGLINIEQNNIIKVLTIVSVIGVPPTLVASLYGMNFKHMPELGWAWGYPYGLLLIFLSAVLPILWFKLRGWF